MSLITVNNHYCGSPAVLATLKEILMNQTELAQTLTETATKVEKIGTETRTLLTKVQELTDALNNGAEVTPEVRTALQALQDQVAVVDDLVPDATE